MTLNYKLYGESGPVILILHGLLGSLDNWSTTARHLMDKHRVYAIDLRNHGRSPHDEDMDYPVMADDILEFCNQQQVDRVSILGHSMGGKVAMLFALDHPERVEKLVVADIAPVFYEGGHEDILSAMSDAPIWKYSERDEVEAFLLPRIPDYGERQFVMKNLSRTLNGFAWKCNLPVLMHHYRALMEFPSVNRHYDGPVFFIKGENSDYISAPRWQIALQFFPQARLLTVSGAGHWVHAENPAGFQQALDVIL